MAEKLYGLHKTTLIDYPGKVASTIFTRGCNLRCPYCHNPDFVDGTDIPDLLSWQEIIDFLNKRKNLIGGVCITGGEPLLHSDLSEKISEIHSLGLAVKIDTNGTLPEKLRALKVDYIAMDIKTSLPNYPGLGFQGEPSELAGRITESIRIIRESGIPHHFRTTAAPGFISPEIIREIITMIQGEPRFVIQGFRPENTLDPAYSKIPAHEPAVLEGMKKLFEDRGISCDLRYNN